ncbi:MAG: GNAT family N-acetyltransferase [Pseudomonadota bacterium]
MGRKVDVTITYLRQSVRPSYAPQPRPGRKLSILRAQTPPVHFYRYLYNLVGGPWHWVSRNRLSDAELAAIIESERVYLYVLYVDGVPAGMAEIDAEEAPVVYIRFFGLAPDFIGKGLSRFFLSNAVDLAWSLAPNEVRIETCTLDHPAALALYQKFGFTVFDQRPGRVELPDEKDASAR